MLKTTSNISLIIFLNLYEFYYFLFLALGRLRMISLMGFHVNDRDYPSVACSRILSATR